MDSTSLPAKWNFLVFNSLQAASKSAYINWWGIGLCSEEACRNTATSHLPKKEKPKMQVNQTQPIYGQTTYAVKSAIMLDANLCLHERKPHKNLRLEPVKCSLGMGSAPSQDIPSLRLLFPKWNASINAESLLMLVWGGRQEISLCLQLKGCVY